MRYSPLLLAQEKDKDEFLKRISSTPRDRKISPTGSDIKLFDVPLHAWHANFLLFEAKREKSAGRSDAKIRKVDPFSSFYFFTLRKDPIFHHLTWKANSSQLWWFYNIKYNCKYNLSITINTIILQMNYHYTIIRMKS